MTADGDVEAEFEGVRVPYTPLPVHEGPPYLTAAILCERAIEDREGLFTLVRVYDELTVTVTDTLPEPYPTVESPLPLALTLFIALKDISEDAPGPLQLRIVNPQTLVTYLPPMEVRPVEGRPNLNIQGLFALGISTVGKFWIEVLFRRRLMTKLPLVVQIQRVPAEQAALGLQGIVAPQG